MLRHCLFVFYLLEDDRIEEGNKMYSNKTNKKLLVCEHSSFTDRVEMKTDVVQKW